MQTTFAEINSAVLDALDRPAPSAPQTAAARVVAGFHLKDASAEEKAVAEAAEAHRAAVETFRADRAAALAVCIDHGIKPLAVIPTLTWGHVCEAAGLFRLHPESDGTVRFDPRAFFDIRDERRMSGADQVEWLAANRRKDFLRRMFPDGVSQEGGLGATLVMPIPPADVADVLLKARGLDLKVATVAEAISFKETPSQLYRKARSYEEAVARALRDDPIIYFEQGAAAAILAQFGDFPIEREIVARVLEAEILMGMFPGMTA